MKSRLLVGLIAGMIALAAIAVASATVTFDPSNGKGFVGKGDIQLPWGWNNQKMQTEAKNLAFTYVTSDTYTVTEVWATGNPDKPWSLASHETTVTHTTGVNDTIAYDARTHKQVDGFNLTGFSSTSGGSGVVPVADFVVWVDFSWDAVLNKFGGVIQGAGTVSLPCHADANGAAILDANLDPILYTEGLGKGVLSVVLDSHTGGLFVTDPVTLNGPLQLTFN
jgi:hypothetical protein